MKELLQRLQIDKERPDTEPNPIRAPKVGLQRRRAWLITEAGLGIAAIMASWYFLTNRPVPVEVLTVTGTAGRAAPAPILTAGGYVKDPQVVYVAPKVAGRIQSLQVKEGDVVKAGDLIAVIDRVDLVQETAEAKANLEFAEANLRKLQQGAREEEIEETRARMQAAQLSRERLERELARASLLFEKGAISAQALDQAQTEAGLGTLQFLAVRQTLALLEAGPRLEEIEAARAAVGAARARWISSNYRLSYARIVAPVTGRVLRKFRNIGDFVSPDVPFLESSETVAVGSPVVSLAVLGQQEVAADINETDIHRISLQQAVEISPNAYPESVLQGTVTQVSPQANKNKNTIEVRVRFDKSATTLPYDTSVKLSFLGRPSVEDPAQVRIPAGALVEEDGKRSVFLVVDARATLRAVEIGPVADQMVTVTGGLSDGDRVIVSSPTRLSDGMRIRVK